MKIDLSFTCRECGEMVELRWDTQLPYKGQMVCKCGHSSGELSMDYVFKEEHRPSWESEVYLSVGSNREIDW